MKASALGFTASVPIPKSVRLCGPSFTDFGIERTLENLWF